MRRWLPVAATLLLTAMASPGWGRAGDPFAFLRPTVVVTAGDRQRLERGDVVVRSIAAADGQASVFAAVGIEASAERVIAWMRTVDHLKRGPLVPAIGIFSTPPRLDDLDGLALDDADLRDLARCRPGDCGLKLTAPEILHVQRAAADRTAPWPETATGVVRAIVLDRVTAYLAGGHTALPAFEDHRTPVQPGVSFAALLDGTGFLIQRLPGVAAALRAPAEPRPDVESLVYWSKERAGGRPILSATHLRIARPGGVEGPEVLVAGVGIFASHYLDASLGLTALARDPGGRAYLVYVNRSEVDLLGRRFGGLSRFVMDRRVQSAAGDVLLAVKRRIESGDPP
ncbi:MAG: hypothetical protein AB7O28_16420 [Vicinamibacterales bacterium]